MPSPIPIGYPAYNYENYSKPTVVTQCYSLNCQLSPEFDYSNIYLFGLYLDWNCSDCDHSHIGMFARAQVIVKRLKLILEFQVPVY